MINSGHSPIEPPVRATILPPMFRELDKRDHNGIAVRLLWETTTNRVILRYRDFHSGEYFTTEVPGAEALAAFRHPRAYRPTRTPVLV